MCPSHTDLNRKIFNHEVQHAPINLIDRLLKYFFFQLQLPHRRRRVFLSSLSESNCCSSKTASCSLIYEAELLILFVFEIEFNLFSSCTTPTSFQFFFFFFFCFCSASLFVFFVFCLWLAVSCSLVASCSNYQILYECTYLLQYI